MSGTLQATATDAARNTATATDAALNTATATDAALNSATGTDAGVIGTYVPVITGDPVMGLTVSASDAHTTVRARSDFQCPGAADDVQIALALAALPSGGGQLELSEGTFVLAAGFSLGDGNCIRGKGDSTIIDVSGVTATGNAITWGTWSQLSDVKIVGNGASDTEGRRLALGDHGVAHRITIAQNNYGLSIANVDHVSVQDLWFEDLRGANGWAAGFHVTGTSNDIVATNIHGEDSDRGIEIEDGPGNVSIRGVHFERIKPLSGYGMVVDVHCHVGGGTVRGVWISDVYLLECDRASVSGASATDQASGIVYENFRIDNPDIYTGNAILTSSQCKDVTFRNIRIHNNTETEVLAAATGAEHVMFDNIHAVSSVTNIATFTGTDIALVNSSFEDTGGNANGGLSITGGGSDILLDNVTVRGCIGTYGLRLSTMTNVTVRNCRVLTDTGNDTAVYVLGSVTNVRLSNNFVEGEALAMNVRATGGRIAGNRCAAGINLHADSSNLVVEMNALVSGSITDAGTGNTVQNNT